MRTYYLAQARFNIYYLAQTRSAVLQCDCAEYKIELETYKTTSKSNLKVSLLSVVEHWSSMKKLAFGV